MRPPADEGFIRMRVFTLLSHYFLASTSDGLNKAVATDWVESLSVFPQDCIEKACAEWRDEETKKPKPADIRKLCIKHFGYQEWEKIMRLKAITKCKIEEKTKETSNKREKPTEEQKRRVSEIVSNMFKVEKYETT